MATQSVLGNQSQSAQRHLAPDVVTSNSQFESRASRCCCRQQRFFALFAMLDDDAVMTLVIAMRQSHACIEVTGGIS